MTERLRPAARAPRPALPDSLLAAPAHDTFCHEECFNFLGDIGKDA
jgi:hypothetical protein